MAENTFVREEEQISSHCYIHPSENPSTQLITLVLNGSNFQAWQRDMIQALEMKNKIQFIDGTLLMPAKDHSLYHAWRRCNSTVVIAWIRNSISNSIAQSIMFIEKNVDVWKDFVSRFSQHDVFRGARRN